MGKNLINFYGEKNHFSFLLEEKTCEKREKEKLKNKASTLITKAVKNATKSHQKKKKN